MVKLALISFFNNHSNKGYRNISLLWACANNLTLSWGGIKGANRAFRTGWGLSFWFSGSIFTYVHLKFWNFYHVFHRHPTSWQYKNNNKSQKVQYAPLNGGAFHVLYLLSATVHIWVSEFMLSSWKLVRLFNLKRSQLFSHTPNSRGPALWPPDVELNLTTSARWDLNCHPVGSIYHACFLKGFKHSQCLVVCLYSIITKGSCVLPSMSASTQLLFSGGKAALKCYSSREAQWLYHVTQKPTRCS